MRGTQHNDIGEVVAQTQQPETTYFIRNQPPITPIHKNKLTDVLATAVIRLEVN